MTIGMLAGLAFGLYYNRRRLWTRYGLMSPRGVLFSRDPWRQMILLMLMSSCIIAGLPQEAWADAPTYDPVFYYYHTDHLGSSMIMTNRDGNLVQHYGYSAFGNERYKANTSAFSVTNRYTGQQLDEDTGLYFYKSRYYDPQLARFTQADSVVPSANTSQALNRYAYVKNNPLKFSDPSGHGWFKKIFGFSSKKFIGAAVTIGLIILAPWGTSFWATFAYSVIGSAVSTAVNGGTFKSFAVGVGIAFAANVVASGMGDGLFGPVFSETLKAGTATLATKAMFAAMAGAASGAISSAVYGQNIEKGLAYGAATGAVAAFGAHVINELYYDGIPGGATDANSVDPNGLDPNSVDPNTVDPNSAAPNGAAEKAAAWAESKLGDKSYGLKGRVDNFGRNDWKCNKFVYDAYHKGAGVAYPTYKQSWWRRFLRMPRNPLIANNVYNVNTVMPNYPVVTNGSLMRGDIIANFGVNNGHMSIYMGNGTVIQGGTHAVSRSPVEDVLQKKYTTRRYKP